MYSQAAASLIEWTNLVVGGVNPAQIAAFARVQLRRIKTDAVDAVVILGFAQSQTPQSGHLQCPVPGFGSHRLVLVGSSDPAGNCCRAGQSGDHTATTWASHYAGCLRDRIHGPSFS